MASRLLVDGARPPLLNPVLVWRTSGTRSGGACPKTPRVRFADTLRKLSSPNLGRLMALSRLQRSISSCVSVGALAAAAMFIGGERDARASGPVSPTGKGIVGGALL